MNERLKKIENHDKENLASRKIWYLHCNNLNSQEVDNSNSTDRNLALQLAWTNGLRFKESMSNVKL